MANRPRITVASSEPVSLAVLAGICTPDQWEIVADGWALKLTRIDDRQDAVIGAARRLYDAGIACEYHIPFNPKSAARNLSEAFDREAQCAAASDNVGA